MEGTYVGRISKSNIRMNQEKHDAKNVIPFVGNSINAKLFVIILFQPIYSILVIIFLHYYSMAEIYQQFLNIQKYFYIRPVKKLSLVFICLVSNPLVHSNLRQIPFSKRRTSLFCNLPNCNHDKLHNFHWLQLNVTR